MDFGAPMRPARVVPARLRVVPVRSGSVALGPLGGRCSGGLSFDPADRQFLGAFVGRDKSPGGG